MTVLKQLAPPQKLTADDMCLEAVRKIETLHAMVSRGRSGTGTFAGAVAEARIILDSLPLTTDEFAIAVNRLRNAARYLKSNERGAACYELNLLSQKLVSSRKHHVAARGRWSRTCR